MVRAEPVHPPLLKSPAPKSIQNLIPLADDKKTDQGYCDAERQLLIESKKANYEQLIERNSNPVAQPISTRSG